MTSSAVARRAGRFASVIVDRALYCDGQRAADLHELGEIGDACRAGRGVAWIGLHSPSPVEIAEVALAFGLHELAVEDMVNAHQRPKLERYGDTLFCVLRPARYIDETETVEFGEVHVFVGLRFVIAVRHSEVPDFASVRHELEARPDLLRRGTGAILHAILDRIVDDYLPVVEGVENDVDEIEDELFNGNVNASRRIYELTREVIQFQRAINPLAPMLNQLMSEMTLDDEELRYLRDVHDHAIRIQEQVDAFRQLLQNILNVNLTLETKALSEISIEQNEQVKRISAWAAILFAPTLVGTTYGMNFKHMPELGWQLGYPFAIALMLSVSVTLYVIFKRREWI